MILEEFPPLVFSEEFVPDPLLGKEWPLVYSVSVINMITEEDKRHRWIQSILEQSKNDIMLHCDICSKTHIFFSLLVQLQCGKTLGRDWRRGRECKSSQIIRILLQLFGDEMAYYLRYGSLNQIATPSFSAWYTELN